MLFKRWSKQLASGICRLTGEQDAYRIALTAYSLEGLFSTVLSVIVLLLLIVPLGITKTAVLIALTGAVVKSFTGGLHLSTPLRCAVWGALVITGVSYLAIYFPLTQIPLVVIAGLLGAVNFIVWLKAPLESKGKPLTGRQKILLARCSKILVLLFSFLCLTMPAVWGINELFYGSVFQVLNLLSISSHIIDKVDRFAAKIEKRSLF